MGLSLGFSYSEGLLFFLSSLSDRGEFAGVFFNLLSKRIIILGSKAAPVVIIPLL